MCFVGLLVYFEGNVVVIYGWDFFGNIIEIYEVFDGMEILLS